MPRYTVIFETTKGGLKYEVPIPEQVPLSAIMSDLVEELEERGYRLAGDSETSLEVIWNGRALNRDIPLPQQGVQPRDTLQIRPKFRPPQTARRTVAPVVEKAESFVFVKVVYAIVAFLPIWIIQYLGLHSGNLGLAMLSSLIACAIAFGLWFFVQSAASARWSESIPFATSLAALTTAKLTVDFKDGAGHGGLGWLTTLPAFILAAAVVARALQQRRLVCGIGGERFTGLQFTCPRCGLVSCLDHWVTERVRCMNCEEQDTPWLALLGNVWWDERAGSSIKQGSCASCRSTPQSPDVFRERRDIRKCQRCGSLQCRWCWDLNNGECVGCGWSMPELPPAILMGRVGRRIT